MLSSSSFRGSTVSVVRHLQDQLARKWGQIRKAAVTGYCACVNVTRAAANCTGSKPSNEHSSGFTTPCPVTPRSATTKHAKHNDSHPRKRSITHHPHSLKPQELVTLLEITPQQKRSRPPSIAPHYRVHTFVLLDAARGSVCAVQVSAHYFPRQCLGDTKQDLQQHQSKAEPCPIHKISTM